MHLYTQAEFRDRIRRKLGIVPPIDEPSFNGVTGQQPTNSPYPTNRQIDDALHDAVSDVNRACGFHVSNISVPVAAVAGTILGPFALYEGDLSPNTNGVNTGYLPVAKVNDIQRLLWLPGDSAAPILLAPLYRDNLDRGGISDYYAQPPSVPRWYYVEGYTLYVTPAQAQAGTYVLTSGTGVTGFACDTSTLDQVPLDYQVIFEDIAIVRLSDTQTMDVEAQARSQAFRERAQVGVMNFKEFILGGTGAPKAQLQFQSYRSGYATRRMMR